MFLPKADRTVPPPSRSRSIYRTAIRQALFSACCFAAIQATGQTAQPDDQPKKIHGTVINAVTQAPIPRALVVSSDNRSATLTDGEGHFEFTIPDDGGAGTQSLSGRQYISFAGNCSWLRARKPGFLDDCNEPGEEGKSSGDDHTIALVPEALIYGRVTVPDNDQLSGTSVQLFFREVIEGLPRWIPMRTAFTNSAGEFRFFDLRPGEYRLFMHERADNDTVTSTAVKAYGYPPVYYPSAADFSGAATIRLSAGQSAEADISAVRQPYYRVTIPVSNSDIASGLRVNVQAQTGPGYSLGYNAAAKRIEGLLPTGNYVVEAETVGESSASGTVQLKVNGAPAEGLPMTLVPDGSLTLNVKEEFTDKTAGGTMQWGDGKRTFTLHGPRTYLNPRLEPVDDLEPRRGGSARPPTANNDNSLILENLVPGHYYWLRIDTGRGYVASARLGDVDLFHQPLTVAGGSSTPVEIEMRDDTAEIDVTVSGLESPSTESGSPTTSPRAFVYCVPEPDSPGQFRRLDSSESGKFGSTAMAPGAYRVLAFTSPQQHLPYRDAEAMKAYDTKGPVVRLTAGEKASVQVSLIVDSELARE